MYFSVIQVATFINLAAFECQFFIVKPNSFNFKQFSYSEYVNEHILFQTYLLWKNKSYLLTLRRLSIVFKMI